MGKHKRIQKYIKTSADEEKKKIKESILQVFRNRSQSPGGKTAIVVANSNSDTSYQNHQENSEQTRYRSKHLQDIQHFVRRPNNSPSQSSMNNKDENSKGKKRKRRKYKHSSSKKTKENESEVQRHSVTNHRYALRSDANGDCRDMNNITRIASKRLMNLRRGLFNQGRKSQTITRGDVYFTSDGERRTAEEDLKEFLQKSQEDRTIHIDHHSGSSSKKDMSDNSFVRRSVGSVHEETGYKTDSSNWSKGTPFSNGRQNSAPTSTGTGNLSKASSCDRAVDDEQLPSFEDGVSHILSRIDPRKLFPEKDLLKETTEELRKLMHQNAPRSATPTPLLGNSNKPVKRSLLDIFRSIKSEEHASYAVEENKENAQIGLKPVVSAKHHLPSLAQPRKRGVDELHHRPAIRSQIRKSDQHSHDQNPVDELHHKPAILSQELHHKPAILSQELHHRPAIMSQICKIDQHTHDQNSDSDNKPKEKELDFNEMFFDSLQDDSDFAANLQLDSKTLLHKHDEMISRANQTRKPFSPPTTIYTADLCFADGKTLLQKQDYLMERVKRQKKQNFFSPTQSERKDIFMDHKNAQNKQDSVMDQMLGQKKDFFVDQNFSMNDFFLNDYYKPSSQSSQSSGYHGSQKLTRDLPSKTYSMSEKLVSEFQEFMPCFHDQQYYTANPDHGFISNSGNRSSNQMKSMDILDILDNRPYNDVSSQLKGSHHANIKVQNTNSSSEYCNKNINYRRGQNFNKMQCDQSKSRFTSNNKPQTVVKRVIMSPRLQHLSQDKEYSREFREGRPAIHRTLSPCDEFSFLIKKPSLETPSPPDSLYRKRIL